MKFMSSFSYGAKDSKILVRPSSGCPLDGYPPVAYNMGMIFIETPIFTKRIQKAMDDDTYAALQQELVKHPDAGDVIQGSGGIRKVRWGGSGRGKRGGSRTLYFWNCAGRIYMLYVYLKNEREDITATQLKQLRQAIESEGLK